MYTVQDLQKIFGPKVELDCLGPSGVLPIYNIGHPVETIVYLNENFRVSVKPVTQGYYVATLLPFPNEGIEVWYREFLKHLPPVVGPMMAVFSDIGFALFAGLNSPPPLKQEIIIESKWEKLG